MTSLPAATFVARKLLELPDPSQAGEVVTRVLSGLRGELMGMGWTDHDAHAAVVRLGNEVVAVLTALTARRNAVLH